MSESNLFEESRSIQCPYCGENIEIVVDPSVESQSYIEDCWVCCRPIELSVTVQSDDVSVVVRREDD